MQELTIIFNTLVDICTLQLHRFKKMFPHSIAKKYYVTDHVTTTL